MNDALELCVEVLKEEKAKSDVEAREGVESVMTRFVVFAESEIEEREGEHGVAGVAMLLENADEREIEPTREAGEAIGDLVEGSLGYGLIAGGEKEGKEGRRRNGLVEETSGENIDRFDTSADRTAGRRRDQNRRRILHGFVG